MTSAPPKKYFNIDVRNNAMEGFEGKQTLGSIKMKMHHKDENTIKKIIRRDYRI